MKVFSDSDSDPRFGPSRKDKLDREFGIILAKQLPFGEPVPPVPAHKRSDRFRRGNSARH